MTAIMTKRHIAPLAAFVVAAGVHVLVVTALVSMPKPETTPPLALGGFEVVDLSAFGVAANPEPEPEPEPEPLEEQPEEEAEVEPEPIVEPIPELEPEVIAEPEPEIIAKVNPAPIPKPVVKPKLKPKVIKKTPPKPVVKQRPKPVETANVQATPQKQSEPSLGSQNAFVPPKSHATYLKNPKPHYPRIALRRGMQGLVLLSVEVSAKGQPVAVLVKKSSGYVLLDKAAKKAVRIWRFAPATRGGLPVSARVDVPIRFSLNDA
ncbi:MAG: energy transducer TonB [Magnetovibrio sp.]|nr:energy transducer TonB [Magnetovibrio sp.]